MSRRESQLHSRRQQTATLTVSFLGCKYEPVSPEWYIAFYDYKKLSKFFLAYVRREKPKPADPAKQLVNEYTRSKVIHKLNTPIGTAVSRREKLYKLCQEFTDNLPIMK